MSSVAFSSLTFNSHIPRFPRPRLPALNTLPDIAGDTVAITFVGYAVSVSLAMIYADKHGYSIHPNQVKCENVTAAHWNVGFSPICLYQTCVWFQELLAHGVSNTVSSFFTCFPSSATLATTNILESAGGHTQVMYMLCSNFRATTGESFSYKRHNNIQT